VGGEGEEEDDEEPAVPPVLRLFALEYSCKDWSFKAELPEWAAE